MSNVTCTSWALTGPLRKLFYSCHHGTPNASTGWPENFSLLRFLHSSTKQKNLLLELAPEWAFRVTWFRSAKTRSSLPATVWFISTQQNEVSTLVAASLVEMIRRFCTPATPAFIRAWYFNWLLVQRKLLVCTLYSIYTVSLMVVLERARHASSHLLHVDSEASDFILIS